MKPQRCLDRALTCLAALTCMGTHGSAQQLFRNTVVCSTRDVVALAYAETGGQAASSQWVQWPEVGSDLTLDQPGTVRLLAFNYWIEQQTAGLSIGGESVIVRIYANDGPSATGTVSGASYQGPGTLLWQSRRMPTSYRVFNSNVQTPQGYQPMVLELPDVFLPKHVTVTVQFVGGRFENEVFANVTKMRGVNPVCGHAEVGSLIPTAPPVPCDGVLWRRVYTATGPSVWLPFEPATDWPYDGYAQSFSLRSGNPAAIDHPFDSITASGDPGTFWSLGQPAQPSGSVVGAGGLEGPNRKITKVELKVRLNSRANTTAKYRVRLGTYYSGFSAMDSRWSSGENSVPAGIGSPGNPELKTISFDVPGVWLGRNACWIIEVKDLASDERFGPAFGLVPTIGFGITGNCGGAYGDDWFQQLIYGFENVPSGSAPYFAVRLTGTSGSEATASDGFQVVLGQQTSGDLASLESNDNNPLVVCKFFVPNQTVDPVNVEITTLSAIPDPGKMELTIRSKMLTAGAFQQTLQFYDPQNSVWTTPTSMTLSTSYMDQVATSPTPAWTIQYGWSRRIKARYSVKAIGPSATGTWCHAVDSVMWRAEP